MERLPGAVSDAEWNYYSGLRFLPPTVWWPADVPSELRLLEDRRWWATTMFEEFAGETLLSFAKRANLQLNLPEAKRNPTRKVLKKTSQVVNLCTWHTEWDFSGYAAPALYLPVYGQPSFEVLDGILVLSQILVFQPEVLQGRFLHMAARGF